MSKLSPSLKALVNGPGVTRAPAKIRQVFDKIRADAEEKQYGRLPWITIAAAATFTLNSPDSLNILHQVVTEPQTDLDQDPVYYAELVREIGLKCISFNGIPRSINCLAAFRANLDESIQSKLNTKPSRYIPAPEAAEAAKRGRALWDSVYEPFADKLRQRLAASHPDLADYILTNHYTPLLSNPPEQRRTMPCVGRSLTSLVAIACLRAQTGVGPQLVSHVFGLRKAVEQQVHMTDFQGLANQERETQAVEKLATDDGSEWILRSVDSIAEAIGCNFASPECKL